MNGRISIFLVVLFLSGWTRVAHCWPIPVSETVNINGRYWAQVDLFTNIRWHDIESICPYDTGLCGEGSLHGLDMSGWTFASVDDLNELFNIYIGSPIMSGNMEYRDVGATWAGAFLSDFDHTYEGAYSDYQGIAGWTRDRLWDEPPPFGSPIYGTLVDYHDSQDSQYWSYADTENWSYGQPNESVGAWFYIDIPSPSTVPLLCLALATLCFARRAS